MSISRLSSTTLIHSLAEWSLLYGIPTFQHSSGCYYVHETNTFPNQARFELFHLTDYMVSSISAGTVWLVAR